MTARSALRVTTDDLGRRRSAVLERDGERSTVCSFFDDVVVGEDEAGVVDDDAGA